MRQLKYVHLFIYLFIYLFICDLLFIYYLLFIYVSYLLRTERYGNGFPVEKIFSAPVQTGPVAHPASYTMSTASLYRW
jgi:hypothetical protein